MYGNKPKVAAFLHEFYIYRKHGHLTEYLSEDGKWFSHMRGESYPHDGGTYFKTEEDALKVLNQFT